MSDAPQEPEVDPPSTEAPGEPPAGSGGQPPTGPSWWKQPWVLALSGAALVGLVVAGVLIGSGNHPAHDASGPSELSKPQSTTSTTAKGAPSTARTDSPPTTGSPPTSGVSVPSTTVASPATTSAPISTPQVPPSTTSTTAPVIGLTGCSLTVTPTGNDQYRFTFSSHLGAGVTVTFIGSRSGRAVTDSTGTAVFTLSGAYAPTGSTGPEKETATGGSCTATASLVLPSPPQG